MVIACSPTPRSFKGQETAEDENEDDYDRIEREIPQGGVTLGNDRALDRGRADADNIAGESATLPFFNPWPGGPLMTEPVISVENVTKTYDDGRVVALRDVALQIHPGEFLAVSGPSGSGKSTLLNMMSGLDRPTRGRVFFEGAEPRTRRQWTAIRARRIGYVFQQFNLLATLSARQNVELPMFGVVGSARERRRRAMALLDRVGLAPRASHRPGELSVGERQRAAIARSLANSPVVILADEPTGNLDTNSSASIMELLTEIHAGEGATLVVVTHELEVAAHAGRLVKLQDGRVVGDETR